MEGFLLSGRILLSGGQVPVLIAVRMVWVRRWAALQMTRLVKLLACAANAGNYDAG